MRYHHLSNVWSLTCFSRYIVPLWFEFIILELYLDFIGSNIILDKWKSFDGCNFGILMLLAALSMRNYGVERGVVGLVSYFCSIELMGICSSWVEMLSPQLLWLALHLSLRCFNLGPINFVLISILPKRYKQLQTVPSIPNK